MRIHGLIISIILLSILYGCADSEVLSTYEGVKEVSEPQVPISFTTYVGDTPDESATTRADWNYLVYYKNGDNGRYNNIPFEGQQGNDSRRLGHLAYNSYIVGVYGFVHQNDWKDAAATAEADFFTNQPLLHKYKYEGSTHTLYWDYSPKKYWPNNNTSGGSNGYSNQTDKVTFISYYPYQGYEDDDLYYRDGEGKRQTEYVNSGSSFKIGEITYYTFENKTYKYSSNGYDYKDYGDWREPALAEKDLENIIPPKAKDNSGNPLTGAEAYTFTFQQREKVTEHIDFMMGINPNCTKQSVTDNVVLNLKHQLCAIRYAVSFNPNRYWDSSASKWVYLEYMPDVVKIEIKSIKLRGLYDKGTIAPVWDSVNEKYDFRWTIDKTIDPVDYTAFYDPDYSNDPKLMYHARWGKKDGYNPATDGLDKKYERKAYLDKNKLADDFYNANNTKGDGLKWLILALPQTVADDTYVDIEYDLTYTYNLDINGDPLPAGQEQNFYYKKCTESFKMPNGTEFKAGKLMQILLTFYWQGISMDAKLTDWPDDEYLDIEGDITIEPEGDE